MIEIDLSNIDSGVFERAISPELEKSLEHFKHELATIRSGRAHTSMVEDIKVTAYGSVMRLKELAAISAPDVRLIVIQPWDKTIVGDIIRGIETSDLGITPAVEGEIIRIQLPQVSQERREELAKVLNKKLEECRVSIRNLRKDIKNIVVDAERKKIASEDFAKRLQDILQRKVDDAIKKAEEMAKKKEAEIRLV